MPGLATLGGRRALLARDDSDTYEITDTRAGYLAEMITRPADYAQRFVEQLSFVPTGGLRWQRNLQIQLPAGDQPGPRWWILPLGPFNRRRLPDIAVINEAGEPLNLLTRKAHGVALAKATLARQIVELSPATRQALERPDAEGRLRDLEERIGEYFVEPTDRPVDVNIAALSAGLAAAESGLEPHPRIVNAREIRREYLQLLKDLGALKEEIETGSDALSAVLIEAINTTQYLCWVWGEPGQVINVRVSYTIADPQHSLKRKTIGSALWAMLTGFFTGTARRRKEAADWYRRFGLAPINYEFNVPTFSYTASYYSTIAPPPKTDLTYLDWELGNSHEERENEYSEVSSSLPSVHIYNADSEKEKGPKSIRAYLRCKPHHHKQILGAALLNILFVWLLGEGRLPGRPGDPLQGLLIAAPSVLVAFLAQQQRHYYEHALRPSRGILWAYLLVGGIFLVAVAFSGQEVSQGGPGLGGRASAAAGLLAVSSVAIFVWHLPLGHMYERIVGLLFQKNVKKGKENWQAYEAAYECFSQWIWRLVVLFTLAAFAFVLFAWDPPSGTPEKHTKGSAESVLIHRAPLARPGGHDQPAGLSRAE